MFRTRNKRLPLISATFGILLSVLMCGAHAADIEKAEYDKGFGAKDAAVRASRSPRKVAEFAGELLESAKLVREDQPYQAYLFNKSYEIGMLFPEGIPFAVEAMDQLGNAQPQLKGAADANLLNAMQRRYQTTGGPQRATAASAYIDRALQIADSLAAAGKYDEAVIICDKAKLALAASAARHNDVLERALMFKEQQAVAKRIAALKITLKTTPHDAVAAGEMVQLLMLDSDLPDQALPYVDATGDARLKKIVALAAKDVATLTDGESLELADWYRGQTIKAGKLASYTAWSRAKFCYQRFLDVHPKLDADRLNATRAMKDAEVALAKTPRVFPEVANSVKHASSLTPANNPGATDLLQPGSVWSNKNLFGMSLTISSREGDIFHGTVLIGGHHRQIVGTVKEGQISWLAKDVIAITGTRGGDNIGKLNGHQLDFTYTEPFGPGRGGEFTLFLDTPTPPGPVSVESHRAPPVVSPGASPPVRPSDPVVVGPITAPADRAKYLQGLGIENTAFSHAPAGDGYILHKAIPQLEWPRLLLVLKETVGLEFRDGAGTDEAVTQIAKLQKLWLLDLRGQPVTDASIAALRNHPALVVIDLGSTKVTGACALDLATIPNVERIYINGTHWTGGLKPFMQCHHLLSLNVGYTPIRDRNIADLAGHPTLETLNLGQTTVTSDCADALVSIPSLRDLWLAQSKFGDEGVLKLMALSNLEALSLPADQMRSRAFSVLPQFKSLRTLTLWGKPEQFTDAEMTAIGNCTRLEGLTLPSGVTDAGIMHLLNLKRLEIIGLEKSVVTERGLAALLENLPQLKTVRVGGTSITQASIDVLKQKYPKVSFLK